MGKRDAITQMGTPSKDKDDFNFSRGNKSGFADRSKSLSDVQATPESDEELSFDLLDAPDHTPWKDNAEFEEELSLELVDAPDGLPGEGASEPDEELSLDGEAAPDGLPGEETSESDEELSLDGVAAPDGFPGEEDSEPDEGLSLDRMDTPGVILSEDAYEKFLRRSGSDLMSDSGIDEPVQNQWQDKKTSVPVNDYKEGANIDLPGTSPQDEKKQANDSIEKKSEFISFYTLGAIIFLMALILLVLYNT